MQVNMKFHVDKHEIMHTEKTNKQTLKTPLFTLQCCTHQIIITAITSCYCNELSYESNFLLYLRSQIAQQTLEIRRKQNEEYYQNDHINLFSTYIWRMVYSFGPFSFKRHTVENQEKSINTIEDTAFLQCNKQQNS